MIRFSPKSLATAAAIAALTAWSAGTLAQQSGSGSQGSSSGQSASNQNSSGQGGSNQGMSGSQNQQQGQSAQQSQQNPEGFVLIRQDIVYLMANEPQNHFVQALADLSQKDNRKAAGELNVAASYIDDISSRDNHGDKQQLSQCADQLRQTARQIQSGQNNNPQQLQNDFAKASLTLAAHFQKSADADLSAQHHVKAGYDFRAAATSLRDALAWTNQQPDQQERQVIFEARRAASDFLRAAPQSEQQSNANWEDSDQNSQPDNQSASGNNANANYDPQQVSQQLAQQIQHAQQEVAQNNNNSNNQNGSTAGNR